MRGSRWLAGVAFLASGSAFAQTTDGSCPSTEPGALRALASSIYEAVGSMWTPAPALPMFNTALSCQQADRTVGGRTVSVGPGGTISFASGLTIDADGAPNAYGPDGLGLDNLKNAGRPGNWWGIAVGPDGMPVVQGPDDPFPGYYVSTTSLENPDEPETSPRRYVDSTKIKFLALPPDLIGANGVKMGDLAAVEYQGTLVFAIVADQGPKDHLGEGSIALATALGIDSDAKRGGLEKPDLRVLLFPGTGKGRSMTQKEIDAGARKALKARAASCRTGS